MIVAVDRLDYTKGIPNRFRTFDRLLEQFPEFRGQVVMIQVAVPSRENVSEYAGLGQQTDELVGRINGRWGTPEWTPLVYIKRGLPAAELAALYATADVCWVGPLRDGMNLVAKEFIACKEGRGGVLVLSEFAGAAAELGEALHVNPYDEERTAEAVARALTMDEDEQRQRMGAMYTRVRRHDVFAWGERFVESLRAAADRRASRAAASPPPLNVDELVNAYAARETAAAAARLRRHARRLRRPARRMRCRRRAWSRASRRSRRIPRTRWRSSPAAAGATSTAGSARGGAVARRRARGDAPPARRRRRLGRRPRRGPGRLEAARAARSSTTSPTARPAASSRRRSSPSCGTTAWSTRSSATGSPTSSSRRSSRPSPTPS